MQNKGLQIAAHGWTHRATTKKTLFHKLHSLFISNNCAEHLSLKTEDIKCIINKSYNWFIENEFQKPTLYVPPAWALGKITKKELSKFPFSHYECTTGLICKRKYRFIPLIGFEEKNIIKAYFRQFFNKINYMFALYTGYIRVAIHPNDFQLHLKDDIKKYLPKKNSNLFLLNELS